MTLALAALVVGLPAAAIAQDAGSNQYQDPLAGEPSSGGGNGGGSSGGGGGGGGGQNTTPSNDSGTQDVQQAQADGEPQAAQNEQLPVTGVDSWLIALFGTALLAMGVGLRLRVGARPTL